MIFTTIRSIYYEEDDSLSTCNITVYTPYILPRGCVLSGINQIYIFMKFANAKHVPCSDDVV